MNSFDQIETRALWLLIVHRYMPKQPSSSKLGCWFRIAIQASA